MADDKANKLLVQAVEMDRKPMTARILARELSVHVQEAQRLLESFADGHTKLARTYRLSGQLLVSSDSTKGTPMDVDEAADNDGKGEGSSGSTSSRPPKLTAGRSAVRRKVVICRSEHADARAALFDPSTLSRSLYSLSLIPLPTSASLVPSLLALSKHPKYLDPPTYGTSQAPEAGNMLKGAEARLKAGQVAERKAAEKKAGGTAAVEPPKGPAKKPGTLDWSKARPAAAEKEQPAPKKAAEPPAPAKKGAAGKQRAVLNDSDDDEPTPAKQLPVSVARPAATSEPKKKAAIPAAPAATTKEERERVAQQKAELAGLFDGDSDDEGTSAKAKGKRKAAPVSDDEEEETIELASPPPKKAPAPRKKPSTATVKGTKADEPVIRNAEGKVRRTRRVVRSEMTMNKRGFMVTEDISDVESYYTDEDSPQAVAAPAKPPAKKKAAGAATAPPAPSRTSSASSTTTVAAAAVAGGAGDKKKPAPAPAKKGGATIGKGGQTSMMSFFGKKP